MDDELDDLSNYCADLVAIAANEPTIRTLLMDRPAGVWVPVVKLAKSTPESASNLLVAWMDSPSGESGYCVILFHEPTLKWSTIADYNAARLLASGLKHEIAIAH
jgi:hypothetical protein